MSNIKLLGRNGNTVDQFKVPSDNATVLKLIGTFTGPHTIKMVVDGKNHHMQASEELLRNLHEEAHNADTVMKANGQSGNGLLDTIKGIAGSVLKNLPQLIDAGKGVVGAISQATKGDYSGLIDAGKGALNAGSKVYSDYKGAQKGGAYESTVAKLQGMNLNHIPAAKHKEKVNGVKVPTVYSEGERKLMSEAASMRSKIAQYMTSEMTSGLLNDKVASNPNSKSMKSLNAADKYAVKEQVKKRMMGIQSYEHGNAKVGSKRHEIIGLSRELQHWYHIADTYLNDDNVVKYGIKKPTGYQLYMKSQMHGFKGNRDQLKERLQNAANVWTGWKTSDPGIIRDWNNKTTGDYVSKVHTPASYSYATRSSY
jgi:hypothetical protein